MNRASVAKVQQIIGYTFTDKSILWEALQAPGSGVIFAGTRAISNDGNKRLALKGDAWIKVLIIEEWYSQHMPKGENLVLKTLKWY